MFRRLWLRLVPSPRKRISRWAVVPLLVYFALVGALVVGLEATHTLVFSRPWMFATLLVAPWLWWLHVAGWAGLPKVRGWMAFAVRLALLTLFAMVLAEPRAVRTSDVLSVMYLVDISDSIGDGTTDQALRFVTKTVVEKPRRDEAGLIAFGKSAAVELPPRKDFPFEALNTQIDRGSTNLEQSLSLAAAMLPDDHQGRIVLITDGVQTDGSVARVLDELKSRDIAVDVLPVDYQYSREVWLERLDLPQNVKIGETYEAVVILSSLEKGEGRLVIRENGKVIAEQTVAFEPGKNRYVVPIALRAAGYYEYTATIETDEAADHLTQNNSVLNTIFVEGQGKVLLVIDPAGKADDWKPLQEAIQKGERLVEVMEPDQFPREPGSLMLYDSVVFVNVANDAFDAIQIQALKDAVYNLGTGFLMVGGANSFGPGGYHRTAVEEMLPVTMDVSQKKILPKGALAIILHTCEFPEGNTWGKRITKQAIKVLGNQDEVGVLVFDYQGGEEWLFELTPASEYEKLATLVNGAEIGDMPSFANTMQMGLTGLLKSDASTKHMIIISDGDPSAPPPELISQFVQNKVSVSMVAVFPHGGEDISKMNAVASVTGGRYYKPDDPNQLPSIFIKESKTLKRSMIQNKTFLPEVQLTAPVLKGIDDLPSLNGYVLTSAKPDAQVILRAPVEDGASANDQLDPVFAIRQHGLGKTAAFTSDLGKNWGAEWVGWGKYEDFVKQLMIEIARVRKDTYLRMSTYTSGGEATLVVEDFQPEDQFLEVKARVTGPGEKTEAVTLRQVAPRRYQATVPLWGQGRYHVSAQGRAGERNDLAFGGFVVSYSPEYLRFRSNRQTIEQIAGQTSGRVLSPEATADQIFKENREPRRSSRPIFDWFLMALAILVPLDVGLRRVQLDWSVLRGYLGFGRRKEPVSATMGTLLDRKQSVSETLQKRRGDRPLPPSSPPPPPPPGANGPTRPSTPPPKPPAGPPPGDSSKPMSTHERLLELKRKKQQDNDGETSNST